MVRSQFRTMKRILIVESALLLFFISSATCADCEGCALTSIVQTTLGPVRGYVQQTVYENVSYSTFKAIPFAKPPIGDLRFKIPQPAEPWTEVYNAIEERPVCLQYDSLFLFQLLGDENCLFLNVYTPKLDLDNVQPLLPVMVWIYGGSYVTGYKNQFLYGPDFFIEEGCVIVAMNYRLGALGFLNLGIKGATGNQGLKDQILALKWVQQNIAFFGGDPTKVTVFGHSAGSAAVNLYLLSSMSKGLFRSVITQSGSPLFLFQTPEMSRFSAHVLARKMDFDTPDLEQLLQNYMKANATKLIEKQHNMYMIPADISLPFMPSIEDSLADDPTERFITECPITLYNNGRFAHYPIMTGIVKNEIGPFAGRILRSLGIPIFNTSASYKAVETLAGFVSNISFIASIDLNQRHYAAYNKFPVYYYAVLFNKFPRHLINDIPMNETLHGDDVGLIFTSLRFGISTSTNPIDPLNILRRNVVKLWTNFVKFGNPTPLNNNPIGVIWEPSGTAGRQLLIDESFRMAKRQTDIISLLSESVGYFVLPFLSSCRHPSFATSYSKLSFN